MIDESRYEPSPDVHARVFDSELVILDLNSGTYFGLNEVGALVWEHISRGETIRETIDAILPRYEISEERLSQDVHELIAQLLQLKLLRGK